MIKRGLDHGSYTLRSTLAIVGRPRRTANTDFAELGGQLDPTQQLTAENQRLEERLQRLRDGLDWI